MVLVTKKKRSAPIHAKRRHGMHHTRDDKYHKAYWPYLPLVAVVGLGILLNTFWGAIQQHVLSYATDMNTSGLLQETNEERTASGLAGLTMNAQLTQAAQAKADDMAARDYWSHNTPNGDPPWVFINNAGYSYQSAGENLAYGFDNSTEAVAGWMNSPGHKANILNNSYKEVGFGVANAVNYQGTGPETIVVAMYASPRTVTAAAAATPQSAKPAAQTSTPAAEQPATPVAEQPTPAPQETIATPAPITENKKNTPAPAESTPVTTQPIARIQLLSGSSASWSLFAVTAIATISAAIFFLRHGLLLHRVLVKSEAFVHKHPFFDIILVAVATIGVILTRTDGLIR